MVAHELRDGGAWARGLWHVIFWGCGRWARGLWHVIFRGCGAWARGLWHVIFGGCGMSSLGLWRVDSGVVARGLRVFWHVIDLWGLWRVGSGVVARGLGGATLRLWSRGSQCGAQAQSLCGMWDPPRSELTPVSLASAGGASREAPRWFLPFENLVPCG